MLLDAVITGTKSLSMLAENSYVLYFIATCSIQYQNELNYENMHILIPYRKLQIVICLINEVYSGLCKHLQFIGSPCYLKYEIER